MKSIAAEKLDDYKELLDKAISYYFPNDIFIKYFHHVPRSRYYTFKYCLDKFEINQMKTIVELGTTRSFVDGRFEGCNSDDIKFWEPHNPEKWDWSAGCFTKVISHCLSHIKDIEFHTIDLSKNHITRCKIMNKDDENIQYHICSSEDFLNTYDKKIDLLYLDTGDMTPIKDTAALQLREAKIIVDRDIINKNGLILIDDIRSCVPYEQGEKVNMGKGYLSIPYFIQHGFKLIMDEYQTILMKN